MIGVVLQGKYRIERDIGTGGYADVFQGVHITLQHSVAIKMLKEDATSDTKVRFVREAKTMAKLNHPNIATVHDIAEYKGRRPYMVMEYVNGPNLLDLTRQRTLTLPQVCAMALQICQGMAYAHRRGIIHRDLTLKNIMIAEEENDEQRVKILDFGLAKDLLEDPKSTKDLPGTPYYVPPEWINKGNTADGRVDVWAFGVGLFRILNGRHPFEAEHKASVMFLILNEREMYADTVNEGMKELIRQCLRKNMDDRIRDFEEMIPRLEAIQQGYTSPDPIPLPPVGVRGIRNPYLNRVMVKEPDDFFGRSREIRRIYSRLDAPHPQSISVVGERKIGKSSLLNYIHDSRHRKRHMQNYENSIFIWLDFQREVAEDYDVSKFIHYLFSMFSIESIDGRDYMSREPTLDQLKATVEELHNDGKRIIILMDEFEAITRNKNFGERFFSFLRSLANSYRVAYVTSSLEDLQEMCHNKDISDSPFFNIFSTLELLPFSREEAKELITVPSREAGKPLEAHVSKILELAGCFPLHIQMTCSEVFEYLSEDPAGEPDWTRIGKSLMREVKPHYLFTWERLDEATRDVLCRIAKGKRIDHRYTFVIEELERRGYVVKTDNGVALFSPSAKKFMMAKRPPRRRFLGSFPGTRNLSGFGWLRGR